jgi:hypothetical protein
LPRADRIGIFRPLMIQTLDRAPKIENREEADGVCATEIPTRRFAAGLWPRGALAMA